MNKKVIGYIFSEKKLGTDEKLFIQAARKKNVELVMLNLLKEFDENLLKKNIKKCNVIYNNSAETFAVEFIKTIESLGKKVIEPSENYYYNEDKWLFFLKCNENNIPVPETILLSENLNLAKKELKNFNKWPVILKRIEGTWGEYVEKADNSTEAISTIKKFWEKGSEKIPIIAQEFLPSYCYRVLALNDKIIQTAVKRAKGWKRTGVYEKRNIRFTPDNELKKIIKKIHAVFKTKIYGIDLLKKNGKWKVLELNSAPGLDFFECERKEIINKVMNFLIKEAK